MINLPAYPWPHCGTGAACSMDGEEHVGERCDCACDPCRIARWGLSRSGIYRPRWQWWFPWGVTRWWLPRAFKGGDEWCQVPACFVIPPLGGVALYLGPRRTMPCAEEWDGMDEAQRADYAPCGRYHGGRLNWAAHHHYDGACGEAKAWLRALGPAGR